MIRVENKHIKKDYASLVDFCRENQEFKYNTLKQQKKPFTFGGWTFSDITPEQIKKEREKLIDSVVDRLVLKAINPPAAKRKLKTVLEDLPKRNRKTK